MSNEIQRSIPFGSPRKTALKFEATAHGLKTGDYITVQDHVWDFGRPIAWNSGRRVSVIDSDTFIVPGSGVVISENNFGYGGSFTVTRFADGQLRIDSVEASSRDGTNMVDVFYDAENRIIQGSGSSVADNNFGIRRLDVRRRDVATETEEDWVTLRTNIDSTDDSTPPGSQYFGFRFVQFPEPFDPDYEYQFRVVQSFGSEVNVSSSYGFGDPPTVDAWWNPPVIPVLGTAANVTATKVDAEGTTVSSATVEWDVPAFDFQKLIVEYQSYDGMAWSAWDTVPNGTTGGNEGQFKNIELPPSVEYRFRVTFSNDANFNYRGSASTSSAETGSVTPDALAAPQNLSAIQSSIDPSQYGFNWDGVDGAQEYEIYLKKGAGSFISEGTVSSPITWFVVDGLDEDDYEVKVASKNDIGSQEVDSSAVAFTVDYASVLNPGTGGTTDVIQPPLNVTVDESYGTDFEAKVTWENQQTTHSENIVEYQVEGSGSWVEVERTDPDVDESIVSAFAGSNEYRFRVTAVFSESNEEVSETSDPSGYFTFRQLNAPIISDKPVFDDSPTSGFLVEWVNQDEDQDNVVVQKRRSDESGWTDVIELGATVESYFVEDTRTDVFFRVGAKSGSALSFSAQTTSTPSQEGLYLGFFPNLGYASYNGSEDTFFTHVVYLVGEEGFLDGVAYPFGKYWSSRGQPFPNGVNRNIDNVQFGPLLDPPATLTGQSTPSESGLYWARKAGDTEWNYVIDVSGESPFLEGNPILYKSLQGSGYFNKINPTEWVWGTQITVPRFVKG